MAGHLKCIDFNTLNGSEWCILNGEADIFFEVESNVFGFEILHAFYQEGRILKDSLMERISSNITFSKFNVVTVVRYLF